MYFINSSLTNRVEKQEDHTPIAHFILSILLALFLFNPFNIGNFIFSIILLYTSNRAIKSQSLYVWDLSFLILVLFTVSYSLISYIYGYLEINTALKYIMYFLTFYLFGKNLNTKNEKNILMYFYMMIIGLSSFGILSVFYSMALYGDANGLSSRTSAIPWINTSTELLATNIGTYLSLGIPLIGMLFVGVRRKLKLFLINLIISVLSIYSTIMLGNRTGLIVAVTSIISISILHIIIDKRNKFLLLSGIINYLFFFLYLYNTNFAGNQNIWENSNSYSRFAQNDFFNDPRFEAWFDAFVGLFTNPFGGKETYFSLGYAHNLWLDVGWTTGLFPASLLLVFTFFTIKKFFVLLHSGFSQYMKAIMTSCLVGFLLTFFVEPIMEGNFYLFTAFCFFSGAMQKMINEKYEFKGDKR